MKNNGTDGRDNENLTLTLLVDTKTASFAWGHTFISAICQQARNKGVRVNVIHGWQQAKDVRGFVALVCVDEAFLRDALDHLDTHTHRILVIDGVMEEKYSQISRILVDQGEVMEKSLALLRSKGRVRSALFGVQRGDTSDENKAKTFAREVCAQDIFYMTDDIAQTFDAFYERYQNYDSVICANDIVAVYLLGRCREKEIALPQELFLIGNSNVWLSSRVTPALTTACVNNEGNAALILQTCKMQARFDNVLAVNILMKSELVERDSTNAAIPTALCDKPTGEVFPSLEQIQQLNQVLSSYSAKRPELLQMLLEGASYEEIAESLNISVDTVKYHIQNLYKSLCIHSRGELCDLLRYYGIQL